MGVVYITKKNTIKNMWAFSGIPRLPPPLSDPVPALPALQPFQTAREGRGPHPARASVLRGGGSGRRPWREGDPFCGNKLKGSLVGGFNPLKTYYCSQIGNLPQLGVKLKMFENKY